MTKKGDVTLALILTLFIICFAVVFTIFFKPLYYFDIEHLNIVQTSGVQADVIKKNYDILIDYQSIFFTDELEFSDFIMSETGRIHFEEVKRIFVVFQIFLPITFIASLIGVIKKIKQKNYRFLKLTSICSVLLPSIFGVLAYINFDQLFVVFHNVVFRNDYWYFDYKTDPIINILPETFFMHCLFLIIGIVVVFSITAMIVYLFLSRRSKINS